MRSCVESYAWVFPDKPLHRRFAEMFKGLIAVGAPIVGQIAASVIQTDDPRRTFHVAKRYYRWLDDPRLSHRSLLKPAYAQTRQFFAGQTDDYLLVIPDFSNVKTYGLRLQVRAVVHIESL